MMLLPVPLCAAPDEVDDDPVAAGAQHRDKGADRRKRPAHIGGQHRIDQIVVERFEVVMRDHPGEAGGVDQDVGAPEAILNRGGNLADLRAVFQRQVHCLVAVAGQLGDQCCGTIGSLVVAYDDARPRSGEQPDACRTDAAAAAGHHRDLAGKRKRIFRCHHDNLIDWLKIRIRQIPPGAG
jgi:hypothetical protein